jgi:L-seryl-tRNA(Ser) seleniumtransferase
MKRALRADKMTLAALEAVLKLYANPDRLQQELPTLRWLTRSQLDIEAVARRLLPHVAGALGPKAEARVVACASQIGSGSLPVESLQSAAIAVYPAGKTRGSAVQSIAAAFRALPVPVVGRISDAAFVMDCRCLEDETCFTAQLAQLKV